MDANLCLMLQALDLPNSHSKDLHPQLIEVDIFMHIYVIIAYRLKPLLLVENLALSF
jgi:hypothetical protein